MKFKVGDTVLVTGGKDKGKQGTVERVWPQDKVLVGGVNLYKRHLKPRGGKPGGIVTRERALPVSLVAVVCKTCHKPTRVGYKLTVTGQQQIFCKKCQGSL